MIKDIQTKLDLISAVLGIWQRLSSVYIRESLQLKGEWDKSLYKKITEPSTESLGQVLFVYILCIFK